MDVRTNARTSAPRIVIYARTRMHIFQDLSAPDCTKTAAPAPVRARTHARTLRFVGGHNALFSL